MEYLVFAFGFIIFIPFTIWAVSAGWHNTRFDKVQQEEAERAAVTGSAVRVPRTHS